MECCGGELIVIGKLTRVKLEFVKICRGGSICVGV